MVCNDVIPNLVCNAPINCWPHYPPLGQWVGKGGDLTKQVIKYPTIWAGQVIKSPPDSRS